MGKLSIDRINGLIYVYIHLWSEKENKYKRMLILVDTGASVTTISDTVLRNLGYENRAKTSVIATVMGITEVYSKTISSLKVGNFELSNIEVYAHDFPDECFSRRCFRNERAGEI